MPEHFILQQRFPAGHEGLGKKFGSYYYEMVLIGFRRDKQINNLTVMASLHVPRGRLTEVGKRKFSQSVVCEIVSMRVRYVPSEQGRARVR